MVSVSDRGAQPPGFKYHISKLIILNYFFPDIFVGMMADVNWSLCCLCQTDVVGEIRCPAQSKRNDKGAGYESLSNALSAFNGRCAPMGVPKSLTSDAHLQHTLMDNHARFHKSCWNKLTRVNRMGKRPYEAVEGSGPPEHTSPAKTRNRSDDSRRSSSSASFGRSLSVLCMFCDLDDSDNVLHSVSSAECDHNVREWASNLGDFHMLGKLPQGDLFANDAVYHKDCMSRYYNLHTSCLRKKRDDGRVNQSELEGIALAETVAYVVDDDSDGPFYIAELGELYKERLKQLGGIVPDRIHTPRFQERILSQITWMRGQKDGNKLYIACEVTIGKAVVRDLHRSADQDACNMARTATLLREHILNSQPRFDGEFAFNAEETSVSQTLSAFVDMVLCGPSAIHNNSAEGRKMASLSIAQLMIYNAVRRTSTGQTATNVRHRIDRETPLAIYIALKV